MTNTHAKSLPPVFLAFDFGSRWLKYVRLQRKSGTYVLTHFGTRNLGPLGDPERITPAALAAVISECKKEMGVKRGSAVASLSARSTLVRHVEFPQMPLDEMKKALKINSAPYLHQQYTDYNFDCYIIPPRMSKTGEVPKASAKLQVLVGGASVRDVLSCRDALLEAELVPLAIDLAPLAMLNAFESSNLPIMQEDTIAVLDIGYENSVVCVVDKGRPVLTRSIPFGGAHVTNHIAKTLSLDEGAAEEEKRKMSEAIQVFVGSCLSVFARQIRSSIDFFERQQEVPVKRVFCSGGTALSKVILQFLTDEIGLPCKSWDPTGNMTIDLKHQSEAALKEQGPDLAVAVGTALTMIS